MADHFTLRVHPENLRDAARKLRALADHCQEQGRQLRSTPDSIGDDWTGDSAVTVKAEMTALGGHVTGFAEKFRAAASALASLASDYEEAQSQIASLNRKWEAADTAYDQAVSAADRTRQQNLDSLRNRGDGNQPVNRAIRDELDQARSRSVSAASDERRTEQRNLSQSYSLTKQWLAHRTRETGRTVDDTLIITVTPEQVAEYRATSVPPLGMDLAALADLALANQKREAEIEELAAQAAAEAADDLAELERLLGDNPGEIADPVELAALMEQLGARADDELYARALVEQLGAGGLNDLYDRLDAATSPALSRGQTPEDWAKALEKFNDVIASGLAQMDDQAVAEFAGGLGWRGASPPRLGLVAASEYADSRVRTMAMAQLERMDESQYSPGGLQDIAHQLLMMRYGDVGAMAEAWASDVDADQVADFLHRVDPATRERVARGLIHDNFYAHDGPFDLETWRLKEQLFVDILGATTGKYHLTASALLASVRHLNTPLLDDLYDKIAPHFEDPEFISILAGNYSAVDHEEIARVLKELGDRVDYEQAISNLISSRRGTSTSGVAEEVGFLLGLMDKAGTEVDVGPVFSRMLDTAITKATSSIPLSAAAVSILRSMADAHAKADKAFEDWGSGLAEEGPHAAFAWTIYIGENGEPPGFADWMEEKGYNAENTPANVIIEDYLSHLRRSDVPSDIEAYEAITDLRQDVNYGRSFGK